jgi:rhodanese-related sulfurtransferase
VNDFGSNKKGNNMMQDGIEQISVEELKILQDSKKEYLLLDVRTPDEYDIAHINGQLIPLQELKDRFTEIDKNKNIIIHCHHGGRSQRAALFLKEQGYKSVKNLIGGIDAWSKSIDANIPRY